ncbi:hypothetical protein ACFQ60_19515 [Streptomyces zhihengii]|uniref:Cysteine-rich protein n=1 Tax=Streptomyces zhihengii TaxID=1818004 RepID=A0ABS2UVN0_9ACTN|nr:hypothetical protein [Streptomyces zhihengii]MBM9621529.1 hypothetical protein [Streptomyces zhihengii]
MNEYNDCIFDGCAKPQRRRGYCHGHASQLQRGEELKALRSYTTKAPLYCSVKDCLRGHHSNGYCEQHSYQLRNGQELRPIKKYSKGIRS